MKKIVMAVKHFKKKYSKAFTLLEILLVVGVIVVLAAIVIIAINPSKQLATVRNTERQFDLKQLGNAIEQYYIDHSVYPASTPTTLTEICNTGSATSSPPGYCDGLVDLSSLVPTYLVAIPTDPKDSTLSFIDKVITKAYASTNGSAYQIMQDSNGKIILFAPQTELGDFIGIGTTTAPFTCMNKSNGFYEGSGSVGDPYIICSWEQLSNMRGDLSAHYGLVNNLTPANFNYSIYGSNWSPIGDLDSFSGSFNGNGHSISGLTINSPGSSYLGLFRQLSGDVLNLGLLNININGSSYVGGITGLQQNGTIDNVYTSGIITGSSYVGGLVGYQDGGEITNSYSTATVNGI